METLEVSLQLNKIKIKKWCEGFPAWNIPSHNIPSPALLIWRKMNLDEVSFLGITNTHTHTQLSRRFGWSKCGSVSLSQAQWDITITLERASQSPSYILVWTHTHTHTQQCSDTNIPSLLVEMLLCAFYQTANNAATILTQNSNYEIAIDNVLSMAAPIVIFPNKHCQWLAKCHISDPFFMRVHRERGRVEHDFDIGNINK